MRVNFIGKIEQSGTGPEFDQVAFGGKYKNLIIVNIDLEILDKIGRTQLRIFQDLPDIFQPVVQFFSTGLSLLVPPVGSKAILGYVVHSSGSDLDLHPFLVGAKYGGMQRFISVRLGKGNPVPQPFRIGKVLLRDHGKYLPAFGLFIFRLRIQDDANGKQIVHFVKIDLLLFHFVPNRVDRLGACLHFKIKSPTLQFFLDGLYEGGDEIGPFDRGLLQFRHNLPKLHRMQVFQRQIEQL